MVIVTLNPLTNLDELTHELDQSHKKYAELEDRTQTIDLSFRKLKQRFSELQTENENLQKELQLKEQTIHMKSEDLKLVQVKLESLQKEKDSVATVTDGTLFPPRN